jgi:hypothetical protein
MIPELKLEYSELMAQYLTHVSAYSVFKNIGIRSKKELTNKDTLAQMLGGDELYTLFSLDAVRWISKNKTGKLTIESNGTPILHYDCSDFPTIQKT